MKRIALFVLTLCVSLNTFATSRFVEGEHYKKFATNGSNQPQVTEYFSFLCPHCYRFEGAVSQIKEDLPNGVKFNKSHVDATGLGPQDVQKSLTLALAIIDKMKLGQKMTAAVFEHLHKKREKFRTPTDIKALFVANGVDGTTFDKAMKNFSVKSAANKMRKNWNAIPGDIRQIGVPSLTVNGKYWINASKLKGRDDYKALIEYLVTKKD